jgi:hypothetical protein
MHVPVEDTQSDNYMTTTTVEIVPPLAVQLMLAQTETAIRIGKISGRTIMPSGQKELSCG